MLKINELEYLEMPGLDVMLGHDEYPEGHQGGVSIILNGARVATNGDLRLDRSPGQWDPVPRAHPREVDRERGEIRQAFEFPDPTRDGKGFNPVRYPDLHFKYVVRLVPEGAAFRLRVDLERSLPAEWVGRVGLQLELFPGLLFGRTWATEGATGLFPLQANGPGRLDERGAYQIAPLATGRRLVVAPEVDRQRMSIELLTPGTLELLDGRGQHTNGWFIVRSLVPAGAGEGAIEWRISPNALPEFRAEPVIQVSQVGYHPAQPKVAVVALDARDERMPPASLARISAAGGLAPQEAPGDVAASPQCSGLETVRELAPKEWGRFLRYRCLQLDFSDVTAPGMYVLRWGDVQSSPFQISPEVYKRHVWQQTLEYFLPVQMCHMRVTDRNRVWHGACHLDDARMAPVNHLHFDGYSQGPSTLCGFEPGAHVPGLDRGGWHDAGDHDLRVESQIDTVYGLALAREAFGVDHDNTTVDQARRCVEIGKPDGRPDILEQIEHGVLTVLGGFRTLGRLYRGIIEPDLAQYTWIGDPANVTDNQVYDPAAPPAPVGVPGAPDDRWVFTEDNPDREIQVAAGLAAAARVLRGHDDRLAAGALRAAEGLWARTDRDKVPTRTAAAVELLFTTGDVRYARWLVEHREAIAAGLLQGGWNAVRALGRVDDPALRAALDPAVRVLHGEFEKLLAETPYGIVYRPRVWGPGWQVQRVGVQLYWMHRAYPELFPAKHVFAALHFVLGCHPGANPASFASGVGARSITSGYGFNRSDGAHIPGGIVSGSALIRPDFVELLDWPHLWQQTEYVLGWGTSDFLFLALAVDRLLSEG
jgi:hypothetical protein